MPKISEKEKVFVKNAFKVFLDEVNKDYRDNLTLSMEEGVDLERESFETYEFRIKQAMEKIELQDGRILACLECAEVGLWKELAQRVEYYNDVTYTHTCVNLSKGNAPAISVRTSYFRLRDFVKEFIDLDEYTIKFIEKTINEAPGEDTFDHIQDVFNNNNISLDDIRVKRLLKVLEMSKEEEKEKLRKEKNYYTYNDMIIISDLDVALEKFESYLEKLDLFEHYIDNSLNLKWEHNKSEDHYYIISEELIKLLKQKE